MNKREESDMELSRYNAKRFMLILVAFFILQAGALLAITQYFATDSAAAMPTVVSELSVCRNAQCN